MSRRSIIMCTLLAACSPDPIEAEVTAVRLIVESDRTNIDRIVYRAFDETELKFEGERVASNQTIVFPTSFVLVVDDELGGRALEIEIDGIDDDVVIASGRLSVALEIRRVVERTVRLDVCNAESCPTGCCQGGVCVEWSFDTCAPAGASCATCPPGADQCVGGQCQCGAEGACGAGLVCFGGRCSCTATSCAGCCDDGQCFERSLADCGALGSTCTTCDMLTANTCDGDGSCSCGGNPPCASGQRCDGATCSCDDISCPNGCCRLDGMCEESMNVAQCGVGGAACTNCGDGADSCMNGVCQCGTGVGAEACADGLSCVNGNCVCDPSSCGGCCTTDNRCVDGKADALCGSRGDGCADCGPQGGPCMDGRCSGCAATCTDGCCSGLMCLTPSVDACGAMGGACRPCDALAADRCTNGACACGAGLPCEAGQRCDTGTCICDATSCPNGCCRAGRCEARTETACGVGGVECVECDPVATDRCGATGMCACGPNGPPCGAGLECIGGACQCSAAGCPNGCCFEGTCVTSTFGTCGTGGANCTACDSVTADGCNTGGCQCGFGPPCTAGQRCNNGTCVCDATSCPNGCCRGGNCLPGTEHIRCGTGGASCINCNPTGGSCIAQQCQ